MDSLNYQILRGMTDDDDDIDSSADEEYFNVKGAAEVSRMILAFIGIPFIDNRISFKEYSSKKNLDKKYTVLPILEFDNQYLFHGMSIARYLAKKYGLSGKTLLEQSRADSVVEIVKDFETALRPFIDSILNMSIDSPHVNKMSTDCINKFAIPVLDRYMPVLESLASNDNLQGFVLQSGISYADFTVAIFFETIQNLLPKRLLRCENIKIIKDRVYSLPELQDYLKSRHKTVL